MAAIGSVSISSPSFFRFSRNSWSNSTSSSAWSCTSVNRLFSRIRSKTFGRRKRRKYGRALPGCRLSV